MSLPHFQRILQNSVSNQEPIYVNLFEMEYTKTLEYRSNIEFLSRLTKSCTFSSNNKNVTIEFEVNSGELAKTFSAIKAIDKICVLLFDRKGFINNRVEANLDQESISLSGFSFSFDSSSILSMAATWKCGNFIVS